MAALNASAASRRRTAPKAQRREQLIKATVRCVARRGLASTTLADVAREARLSQGIINLHFQSKEKLLVETLRYLADDYKRAWEKALDEAGPTPAQKLAAMVDLDFRRGVCDRNKLGVWFAFWGEAKSRPTYRKLCRERDRVYLDAMQTLCERIVADGPYEDIDPGRIATGLSAMVEGLWLDLLITPDSIDSAQACEVCHSFLATVFPAHFPLNR